MKNVTLAQSMALFLITLYVSVPQAWGQEMSVLTTEEPPMNFTEDGKVTGIITDVVRGILKRTGENTKIEIYPWARTYAMGLRNANTAIYTAARTIKREELFQWVGPVIRKRWVLYSLKDANLKISSLVDAKKVSKIAVMNGDARAELLKDKGFSNLDFVTNHEAGIRLLFFNRVNLFASSDIEGPLLAKKAGLQYAQMKIVYTLKEIHSYILISKRTPKSRVSSWQEALETMRKNGEFATIGKRWSKKLGIPLSAMNGIIEIK